MNNDQLNIFDIAPILNTIVTYLPEQDKVSLTKINSLWYHVIKTNYNLDQVYGKMRFINYLMKTKYRMIGETYQGESLANVAFPHLGLSVCLMFNEKNSELNLIMESIDGTKGLIKICKNFPQEFSLEQFRSNSTYFIFHQLKKNIKVLHLGKNVTNFYSLVLDFRKLDLIQTKIVPHLKLSSYYSGLFNDCKRCASLFDRCKLQIPDKFVNKFTNINYFLSDLRHFRWIKKFSFYNRDRFSGENILYTFDTKTQTEKETVFRFENCGSRTNQNITYYADFIVSHIHCDNVDHNFIHVYIIDAESHCIVDVDLDVFFSIRNHIFIKPKQYPNDFLFFGISEGGSKIMTKYAQYCFDWTGTLLTICDETNEVIFLKKLSDHQKVVCGIPLNRIFIFDKSV